MSTMTLLLPDSLQRFIEEQVAERGLDTPSAYVSDLIRRDQDRRQLRGRLLEGAASPPGPPVDQRYFDGLRDRAKGRTAG